MKTISTILLFVLPFLCSGQDAGVPIYGFRHYQMLYKGDSVDILVKSKAGQENTKKPLFFFCQGSLPIPLMIKYKKGDQDEIANVFPFINLENILDGYHLAIVGKPAVPLIADEQFLNEDMAVSNNNINFLKKYTERNVLSYYTARNINVINFLKTLPFVSSEAIVLAGHSEGSTIAAKMATIDSDITALIYSGGNPLGRIMTAASRSRAPNSQLYNQQDSIFANWKRITRKSSKQTNEIDPDKTTLEFSIPAPIEYLKKLTIPVLVTFGSKDYGLLSAEDYLRIELIRLGKNNFTFKEYQDMEHNFFAVKPSGEIDYDKYNWDKVADDWLNWLKKFHTPIRYSRNIARQVQGR